MWATNQLTYFLSYISLTLMAQSFTLLPMVLAIIIRALTLATMVLVKSTITLTFEVVISPPTLIHYTCIHACFLQTIDSNKFNHSYT